MLDIISQVGVTIFGVTAVFLVGSKSPHVRRYGYLSGLLAQPFWYFTFITHQQYAIVVLSLLYTVSWIRGLKNNWTV